MARGNGNGGDVLLLVYDFTSSAILMAVYYMDVLIVWIVWEINSFVLLASQFEIKWPKNGE